MNLNCDNFSLILLTKEYFHNLYSWSMEETNFEQYTCRPVNFEKSYDEYVHSMLESIRNSNKRIYILVANNNPTEPLGKITLFDYNPRNHSAEFGYYFPDYNRGKGLGSIILELFFNTTFTDNSLNLHKLYATTASNNIASIKLLEKFNLKLDGKLRDHYWIDNNKYSQCIYSILKSEWALTLRYS